MLVGQHVCWYLTSLWCTFPYFAGSYTYTYAPAVQLPLWYQPDGTLTTNPANFDDFKPFGGFTAPYAKQYFYAYGVCGVTYLYEDWAPVW